MGYRKTLCQVYADTKARPMGTGAAGGCRRIILASAWIRASARLCYRCAIGSFSSRPAAASISRPTFL